MKLMIALRPPRLRRLQRRLLSSIGIPAARRLVLLGDLLVPRPTKPAAGGL